MRLFSHRPLCGVRVSVRVRACVRPSVRARVCVCVCLCLGSLVPVVAKAVKVRIWLHVGCVGGGSVCVSVSGHIMYESSLNSTHPQINSWGRYHHTQPPFHSDCY